MKKIILLAIASVSILLPSCDKQKSSTMGSDKSDLSSINSSLDIKRQKGALNFLVIGDWGRMGEFHQTEVAQQMDTFAQKTNAKFTIATGDNFYDNGVRSVNDPQWFGSFENIYKGSALQRDWFVVLGNHDYQGNPQAEIDYSKISRRWNMPSRYFAISKKINDTVSAKFIFIDTSPFVESYQKNAEQYADLAKQDTVKQLKWLDSVLANSKEQWKIVTGHHPIYSTGSAHGNTQELFVNVKPMLEKYHVQLYLAGHEHDLQHQKPEDSYVEYIVSGAGSETRPTSKSKITEYANDVSGFALLSINSDSLKINFIDYEGNIIYRGLKKR